MIDDPASVGEAIARRAAIEAAADDITDWSLDEMMQIVRDEHRSLGAYVTVAALLAMWAAVLRKATGRRTKHHGVDVDTLDLITAALAAESMPYTLPLDVYQTISDVRALAAQNGWDKAATNRAIDRALTLSTSTAKDAVPMQGLGLDAGARSVFAEPLPTVDAAADILAGRSAAWRKRAKTQAQSAATEANSIATIRSIETGPYPYKQWLTMRDSRVREAHVATDRDTVQRESAFIVRGEPMMYPGDRSASIDLWINCRCIMLATAAAPKLPPPWGA